MSTTALNSSSWKEYFSSSTQFVKSQKNTEIQLAQATKREFQNNFNLNVQHRHGGAAHCVMVFSETSLERQELFDLRDMSVHLKPALCHIKGHLCILAKMEGLQVYKEHVTCRIQHVWL